MTVVSERLAPSTASLAMTMYQDVPAECRAGPDPFRRSFSEAPPNHTRSHAGSEPGADLPRLEYGGWRWSSWRRTEGAKHVQ